MIIRNPTDGSIGIAIHSIIQLAIAKKQPKNFLGFFASINSCMKTLIRCHTLFDITGTGILNRKAPLNLPPEN